MKGVILAGGSGTRLYPVTSTVNKHLLPIYNKPLIYYPLSVLMISGIRDILLISNPENIANYRKLFGDGSQLGMRINYAEQTAPRGLADGLIIAEDFAGKEDICLILGDNIFFGHGLPNLLIDARKEIEEKGGAYVFGYYVNDPQRYGIVEFDSTGKVSSIVEKPSNPRSNFAVVGLYFYDNNAIKIAKSIKPSDRGELEITTVNETYLKDGKLKVKLFGRGFAWFDAGTHESFAEAGEFIATIERRTALMVGCIEEIAYKNNWINKTQLKGLIKSLSNSDYGQYLAKLTEEYL